MVELVDALDAWFFSNYSALLTEVRIQNCFKQPPCHVPPTYSTTPPLSIAFLCGLARSVGEVKRSNSWGLPMSSSPVAVGVLVGSAPDAAEGGAATSSATVVYGCAVPAAPAQQRPQSALPLRVIAEILRENLDLKGSVTEVVRAAVNALELEERCEGQSLIAQARLCHEALCGTGPSSSAPLTTFSRRPGSARAGPRAPAAAAVALADGPFAPVLRCRGVDFGFQYHNFYGDWHLSTEQPQAHGRPHYEHNTMYGGTAHLFHVIDPTYNVPRWVLGPSPGNENGWAFCESDAPTPHEVHASWISWDGFEWHSSPSLRFVEPSPPGVEDEESDYEEETALEARFVNEQGEGQLGGAWQEAPAPASDGESAYIQRSGETSAGETGTGTFDAERRRDTAAGRRTAHGGHSGGGSRSRMCLVM